MKNSLRNSLIIGALASTAAFVSAHASSGRELIISAPIQQVDRGADTVTVLGQTFDAQVDQLSVGEVVKVYGVLQKDGSIKDSVVQGTGTFGANGDPVFLKGLVTATDPALGHAEVDGMTVDYTSELADADFAIPNVGDVITLTGSEPVVKGVLVASATGAGAYATTSQITGGGFAAAQITGGGLNSAQITGGGLNSAQITGGGLNSAQITGGGLNSAQITGGGLNSAQITGGGLNSAQITGGGLNSAQITGGGLNSAQITGGGLNSAQITGGGLNSAQITGGGLNSAQITGGGLNSAQITGGGLNSAQITGGGLNSAQITGGGLNSAQAAGGGGRAR